MSERPFATIEEALAVVRRPTAGIVTVAGGGYPASAERSFTLFALPLLRRLLGEGEQAQDGVPARLGHKRRKDDPIQKRRASARD